MTNEEKKAPILVGVGEASKQSLALDWPSPVDLASSAVKTALADSGADASLAASIDYVLATRLFHDSGLPYEFGSPENFPEAVATAAGLKPARYVYGDVGGQSPQRYVNQLAAALYEGEMKAVLIAGTEAMGTVKRARKTGHALDWNQPATQEMEDKRSDFSILTMYEIRHGIISMPIAYGLLEQARRKRLSRDRADHARDMAALWSAFSSVAGKRKHAQFAKDWSVDALLSDGDGNYRLNDPYRRWMVAQDAVDVGAAVIMTTAGHAEELGIPRSKWVYLISGSDSNAPLISEQSDLSRSPAMEWAVTQALDKAELTADQLGPVDIYSCFPVAVSHAVDALNLPDRPLASYTMTGGLSFFGGPGNSYSLHAIAAAVETLRADGGKPALVSANGGVINKESIGIYAAQPAAGGWTPDRLTDVKQLARGENCQTAYFTNGNCEIKSYVTNYGKDGPANAVLWIEDEKGVPALALLPEAPGDTDLIGEKVMIESDGKRNHARLTG